jgi:hypothetical protein
MSSRSAATSDIPQWASIVHGIRPESVIVPSVRWKLGRYVTVTVPSSIRNPGVFPSK